MKLVGINDGSDLCSEIPKVPSYLGVRGKHHFKEVARVLIGAKVLKNSHVTALSLLAENMEQWEWAIKEIRTKNKENRGSGYIQEFKTGAKNISVEVTLKRDAEKAIMQCLKQFGLDPKSEKELKIDPNQGNLFDVIKQGLGKTS